MYYTGRGPVPAVRGINLSVSKGRATALVGESGSGKSTAALSVMRLIKKPLGDVIGGEGVLDGRHLPAVRGGEGRGRPQRHNRDIPPAAPPAPAPPSTPRRPNAPTAAE